MPVRLHRACRSSRVTQHTQRWREEKAAIYISTHSALKKEGKMDDDDRWFASFIVWLWDLRETRKAQT